MLQRAEAQAAAATARANEAQKELHNAQEKIEATSSRAAAMAEDNDALLEQVTSCFILHIGLAQWGVIWSYHGQAVRS